MSSYELLVVSSTRNGTDNQNLYRKGWPVAVELVGYPWSISELDISRFIRIRINDISSEDALSIVTPKIRTINISEDSLVGNVGIYSISATTPSCAIASVCTTGNCHSDIITIDKVQDTIEKFGGSIITESCTTNNVVYTIDADSTTRDILILELTTILQVPICRASCYFSEEYIDDAINNGGIVTEPDFATLLTKKVSLFGA